MRLYHVVAKVTTRFGVRSNGALKGDVIYFPHDAPDVVARTLEERVDWVRSGEFRVALVGPDGERDKLAGWLKERGVVSARPIVCYNHLAVRAAIDTAMENRDENGKPKITDVPDLEMIKVQLDGLSASLLDRARHMSGEDTQRVEEGQQAAADDVASVREQDDSLGRVALLSSSSTANDVLRSAVAAAQCTRQGVEDGADCEAADDVAGGNTEPAAHQAPPAQAPAIATRGKAPLSEFEENGLHLMRLFREVFPLMRFCYTQQTTGKAKVESWPIGAHGSLSNKQTRHLLLQFSTVAARNAALIFTLANQKQRHSTVRAVSARVRSDAFDRFVALINETGFWETLDAAADDPNSTQAQQLQRRLVPLLTLAGKEKPWGKVERSAMKGKILAVAARHGDPSVFLTISPDDVHQMLSIRLSYPSTSNQDFPASASDAVLREHRSPRNEIEFSVQLQRRASENPVATSVAYDWMINAVFEVLVGLPKRTHRRKSDAILDCVVDGDLPQIGKRRPGIFGVPVAAVWVTETSGRKALHLHSALWTCLSPRLLAKLASHDELLRELIDAINTQCRAEVGWEVHAVQAARTALKVSAPPPAFWTPSTAEEAAAVAPLFARQVGTHVHQATCHKGPQGAVGCRGGHARGHHVEETGIVQLINDNSIDTEEWARLHAHSQLAGDGGAPARCSAGCKLHWFGEEGEGEKNHLPLTLLKPQPLPTLPTIPEEDGPLLPVDDRALGLELARPPVRMARLERPLNGQERQAAEDPEVLDRAVHECDMDNAVQVADVVRRVLDFPPVTKLLGLPMFAPLRERLANLTSADAQRLLVAWRGLGCANADLVDWNEVLTPCTGSNTAPYLLGAGQSAAAALYYLVKYACPLPRASVVICVLSRPSHPQVLYQGLSQAQHVALGAARRAAALGRVRLAGGGRRHTHP